MGNARTVATAAATAVVTSALVVLGTAVPANAADTLYLVDDVRPGLGDSESASLVEFDGALFFAGADFDYGSEVRRSDGTAGGTVVVKDLNPGGASSDPRNLTVVGDTLFFAAGSAAVGYELYRTDGTAAGTVLVKDIAPGAGNSFPEELTAVGDRLYFTADDGTSGRELWTSDGTTAGTVRVADIRFGSFGSEPRDLTAYDGALVFGADDGTEGQELWRTDGTTAGTTLVKDFATTAPVQAFFELTEVGGVLYLSANDGTHGQELWTTDGTPEGTNLVVDLLPGAGHGLSDISLSGLTASDGELFLAATDGESGIELWRSDGTADGTTLVKDINPGPGHGLPFELTVSGGALYFGATGSGSDNELWRSDGTAGGTAVVEDINPGPAGSYPYQLTDVAGVLYFGAEDGTHGTELWRSDGTPAGTYLLEVDSTAGGGGSIPDHLAEVAGSLYLVGFDGAYGRELWRAVPNGGDTPTPETTITAGPAQGSTITDNDATFVFSGSAGLTSSFQCRQDGLSWFGCFSPFTWSSREGTLMPGQHTFEVRGVNAFGNPDPTPAVRQFTVKLSGPVGPPAQPSNAFTPPRTGKADLTKGTLALTVALPGRGRLVLESFAGSPVKTATATLGAPGKATLTLKLTKAGTKQLKKNLAQAIQKGKKVGKLKVRVNWRYTPTGGEARNKQTAYVVKLKKA